MYENLNKPFKIRNLTIKNRITMSPMGIGFVYKPTGEITEAGHDYFAGPSELPVHEMPEMTCHALTVDEIHEKSAGRSE